MRDVVGYTIVCDRCNAEFDSIPSWLDHVHDEHQER